MVSLPLWRPLSDATPIVSDYGVVTQMVEGSDVVGHAGCWEEKEEKKNI
jgi:hypothetical protein